jgi:hypothetical protein
MTSALHLPAAQKGQFPGLGSSMRLAAPFYASEVT